MDFLFVNSQELTALMGLPYVQQSTYLLGIRPYMDRATFMVGIKRRISYQSLAEALYVEPHQGLKQSGSPSRQQLRRVIYALERVGLVAIQSSDKHLILKCLLADSSSCVRNKPDTNPTQQTGTNQSLVKPYKSERYDDYSQQRGTAETLKADIPHKSNNYFVCLQQAFEKFWHLYPNRRDQLKAWDAFTQLNPDRILIQKIMQSLAKQIENKKQQQAAGAWVPNWKNPANWLAQQCWNDDLIQEEVGVSNAKHTASSKKQNGIDLLWESCKDGAEFFDFDYQDSESVKQSNNVIQFKGGNTA